MSYHKFKGHIKQMHVPVCTLSPICRSDIVTDLPFWRLTLAVEGKHEDEAPGAFVCVGIPSQQCVLIPPHLATHIVGQK